MINYNFEINELPPSVNRMYRPRASMARGLYIQKDQSAGAFEYSAGYEVEAPSEPFDCKLSMSIIFEIENKKKLKVCDTDNMLKCLFDTLQKIGVIKNDNLIYKIQVEKRGGKKDKVIGHITEYK